LALAGEFGTARSPRESPTPIASARCGKVSKQGASKPDVSAEKMPIVSLTAHLCAEAGRKVRLAAREGEYRALGDGEFSLRSRRDTPRSGYLPEAVAEVYKGIRGVRFEDEDAAGRALSRIAHGHCTYVAPLEQKYVTPDTIAARR